MTSQTSFPTLEQISNRRDANRDDLGRIKNKALDRRLQVAERAELVRLLGWTPEPARVEEHYAASTGEMRKWLFAAV